MTMEQRIAELEARVEALEQTIEWLQENGALKMWEEIAMACGLTPMPAKLAALLYSATGTLTHRAAWELWGEDVDAHGGLKVAISRVRKALGKDAVLTVAGVGYQMPPEAKARLKATMERRRG